MENRIGAVVEPFRAEVTTRELRPMGADEAVVAVKASAICGSDLHIYKGKHPSVSLPATIGHEFAGDIVQVGAESHGFKEGDRVTLEPAITCGTCAACRRGDYGYCENISFSYRVGDGAMADYIVAKTARLYRLPEGMSYEAGALVEPLAVAIHAVRRAEVRLGDRVAVFGAGAIGIFIAAVCRACGASFTVVTDLSPRRLKAAVAFGATYALNPAAENVMAVLSDLSPGGMDKTFECVGRGETFSSAMSALKKNGLMTQVGIFEHPEITINASRFVTHEITIRGAQGYCWDFDAALELAAQLDVERLVTHRFPLSRLQEALDTVLDTESGAIKVLVCPQVEEDWGEK
ncbi:MAG: alcohol dehydrogenase catalytic domain-containing protein [Synergistaceae bacterium]|jgi:(R,R)-butanediol dehydrogenase/meso-butanediol dehydrogenase/diacetyl reductase/L-iditol 2-dehydrogenase|nr:alcohol dehydrogenase catalytic domain-containing protein [Synergistaceae bacterium]